jgi:hypothetical protein
MNNLTHLAYPSIPAPRDLLTCKRFPFNSGKSGHRLQGYAVSDNEPGLCSDCHEDASGLQQLGGFMALDSNATLYIPPRRTEMHIAQDLARGTVNAGQLFGYQVFTEGQWFFGELWCYDNTLWNELAGLLDICKDEFTIRIGKATHRGYGKVTIRTIDINLEEPPLGCGLPIEERIDLTQPITMTFLSDAIIQDGWGRTPGSVTGEFLGSLLGTKVDIIRSFCRHTIIDGFRGHTGLPRIRSVALKAGSALGFKVKENHNDASLTTRLKELEVLGIGIRTSEGFGQVCFNHPVYRDNTRTELNWLAELPEDMLEESHNYTMSGLNTITEQFMVQLKHSNLKQVSKLAISRLLASLRGVNKEVVLKALAEFYEPKNFFPGEAFPDRNKKTPEIKLITELRDMINRSTEKDVEMLITRLSAELLKECEK